MAKIQSKQGKKSLSSPKKKKNAVAHKKAKTLTAQNTDRQQYTFTMGKSDNLAQFDEAGGAIEFFLPEFVDFFEHQKPGNWENIVYEFFIGVSIHEDVHVGISNTGENWSAEQEHNAMYELFRPDKS